MHESNKALDTKMLGTLGAMNAGSPIDARQSEVSAQISFCHTQTGALNEVLDMLIHKLEPVLNKRNVAEKGQGDKPMSELTPLANEIRIIGNSVQMNVSKIQRLIDQIEI